MASKPLDPFSGFSKLKRSKRLEVLEQEAFLEHDGAKHFKHPECLNPDLAEHFIENVIGYFPIPLGVGVHLCIDGNTYAIPMAVEETSIIASLSKTAKWLKNVGNITTSSMGQQTIIGQIQVAKTRAPESFRTIIESNAERLIEMANHNIAQGLVRRGGGVKSIVVRQIDRGDGSIMSVIHVHANTVDAMGANIITQICEYLKGPIETLTDEEVNMCILSNLSDEKLTKAEIRIHDIDPELGEKIAEASLFAKLDPYRAATHNKGVLNGIDPILIATGNDWRAVEAAVHAYASKDGQYRAITDWQYDGKTLIGTLIAPIVVGTVGGMTKLHPTAQVCLSMMKINNAQALSRIAAAVGLVQNLGALKALTTVGLVQGHMKLHITNLSLSAGARAHEMPLLQKKLEELLSLSKQITLSNAIELLKEIRNRNLVTQPQEQTV